MLWVSRKRVAGCNGRFVKDGGTGCRRENRLSNEGVR